MTPDTTTITAAEAIAGRGHTHAVVRIEDGYVYELYPNADEAERIASDLGKRYEWGTYRALRIEG